MIILTISWHFQTQKISITNQFDLKSEKFFFDKPDKQK